MFGVGRDRLQALHAKSGATYDMATLHHDDHERYRSCIMTITDKGDNEIEGVFLDAHTTYTHVILRDEEERVQSESSNYLPLWGACQLH